MLFSCLQIIFFKIIKKNIFLEHHKRIKQIGSRSGQTFYFVGPDLGSNCLHIFSKNEVTTSGVMH